MQNLWQIITKRLTIHQVNMHNPLEHIIEQPMKGNNVMKNLVFHKCTRHFIRTALVASLLVTPLSPVFAQSTPELVNGAASTTPAATETIVEVVTTFDSDGADVTSTAQKESIQTTEKTVPNDTDSNAEVEGKQYVFLPIVEAPINTVGAAQIAPPSPWKTIEYETFEGNWPDAGWQANDCNGSTGGVRYWDDENYKPKFGSWSAWPAGDGANALNPRTSFYPNYACAQMTYGPFSLNKGFHLAARLTFDYWNQSERNYDWFAWMASCNGVNFYGRQTSGDSGGWRHEILDLANVPGLGSCLGDSTVWIRFRFTSDSRVTDDGPFVDNIVVEYQ